MGMRFDLVRENGEQTTSGKDNILLVRESDTKNYNTMYVYDVDVYEYQNKNSDINITIRCMSMILNEMMNFKMKMII